IAGGRLCRPPARRSRSWFQPDAVASLLKLGEPPELRRLDALPLQRPERDFDAPRFARATEAQLATLFTAQPQRLRKPPQRGGPVHLSMTEIWAGSARPPRSAARA